MLHLSEIISFNKMSNFGRLEKIPMDLEKSGNFFNHNTSGKICHKTLQLINFFNTN